MIKAGFTRRRPALTLAALLVGAAAATPAHAAQSGLNGVWKVAVTRVDCVSGAVQGAPFMSLLGFAGDGLESETTNNPIFQPGQRSPAFGAWTHVGGAKYHLDTYAFILFPSAGPPPIAAGSQQISQDITVSGDSYSSVATVSYFDTSGNLLVSGCATAAGARLK